MMLPMAMSMAAVGAGLAAIGAGIGIGLLWAAGLQGIARQPELEGKLKILMYIGAAFVEGVVLFALLICYMNLKG